MRRDPGEWADGLTQWRDKEDSPEAEAASVLFAEVLLMVRARIEAEAKAGK